MNSANDRFRDEKASRQMPTDPGLANGERRQTGGLQNDQNTDDGGDRNAAANLPTEVVAGEYNGAAERQDEGTALGWHLPSQ